VSLHRGRSEGHVETDVFGTIPTTSITKVDSGSLRASHKMDLIANHYAARRGVPASKKRKSDVLGNESAPARTGPVRAQPLASGWVFLVGSTMKRRR
jgi:hypothetical protein